MIAACSLPAAKGHAQDVSTDNFRYLPGETVTVAGQGWQPQEKLSLSVGNTLGTRTPFSIEVTADANGSFTDRSFVVQETDRGQMLILSANGASGAGTVLAMRGGVAPGYLKCSAETFDTDNYGILPGESVSCIIDGAADLSSAQQAGVAPVVVLVKSAAFGVQHARVDSNSGKMVMFTWTPPADACGQATVTYGPIRACNGNFGKCTTFAAEGNEANTFMVSGGDSDAAAGFVFVDAYGNKKQCPAPKLAVQTLTKNDAFVERSQAHYTMVVRNSATGSTDANVRLTDRLPANGGLVWETATTTQGTCNNPIMNNTLDCSLGTIAADAPVTVTVTSIPVTPTGACQAQPDLEAVASADGGRAYGSGSLSCAPSAPPSLDVRIEDGSFTQRGEASLTVVVSNYAPAGAGPATDVRLRDDLPGNGGLLWTSVTSTAGSCSILNNLLSCALGDIPAGQEVRVTAKSGPDTPYGACQRQSTGVAVGSSDGAVAADFGAVTCTPSLQPVLNVEQNPKGATFTAGSPLNFEIVVRNDAAAGSPSADNVQLTEKLPATGAPAWAYFTSSQGSCSLAENTLNCSLGSIAPGGSATISVSTLATTPAAACGRQQGTATATAAGGLRSQDYGWHNCTSALPGLSLRKTASTYFTRPGDSVTYTYTVTNTGEVALSNITVKDDNGTPYNTADDFTVGTIATLSKGASANLKATAVPTNTSISARLGSAGPSGFTILSLGGDAAHSTSGIVCSNATVSGNLGVASYGQFSNAAPCTENGNFYKGVNVRYSGPGKLKGSTITDEALMAALRADAINAGKYFAGLPVTSSVQAQFPSNGYISGSKTVTGTPGINVVKLTGLTLKGNLNLTGPRGTHFVLNISGPFNLHSGNITAGDGVGPYDVLYNITNPAASVKTMMPTTAVGILLAPYNAINAMDSSNFYGEVIGGYNQILTLMSGTRVNHPAPPPPSVTNTATASAMYDGKPVTATATATVYTSSLSPMKEPD